MMRNETEQKIFDLACKLARGMNAARRRGAVGEINTTYADGVFLACEMALKELHEIGGDKVFQPYTKTLADGRKTTIIFGGAE